MERDPSSTATLVAPQLFTLILNSTHISCYPKGSCGTLKLPAELLSEEGSRGPQMPAHPSTNSRTLGGCCSMSPGAPKLLPTAPENVSPEAFLSPCCVGMRVQALRPSRSVSACLFTNSIPGTGPHSLQKGTPCSHPPSQSTESHVLSYDLPATSSNS